MHLRLRSAVESIRASLFLVPMTAVVFAIAAGMATLTVDSRFDGAETDLPLVLASTVESARALLSTIAGATITFAGIAFSVSLLVIQRASSQYSPRVVHSLFRDPFNKRVMAAVIGTFTYCLVVLRSVRSPIEESGDPVIPNLSVGIALVLGIAAILAVVAFIDHSAHAMDVSEVLERVTKDAIRSVQGAWAEPDDHDHRADPPQPVDGGRTVRFERAGWVQLVDTTALLACAPDGATVTLHTYPGRYAIEGSPLCTVSASEGLAEVDEDAVRASIAVGNTRTMQQDVSYGLRQLVDVALRALSPGINDPTTAQDAIFHATAVLAELLRREPAGTLSDEGGRALFMPEAPDHVELIRLGFEEARRAAADHPTVCVYLLKALQLLVDSTGPRLRPDAREEILRQARLVILECERADPVPEDLARVRAAGLEFT